VEWLDSDGKTRPLLAKPGTYLRPRLSPDGQRLALEMSEGPSRDIWIYEWQRNIMRRLTFATGILTPVWSPDGRYILFAGRKGIFWTRSDGGGKPQPLTQGEDLQVPFSFMPDGKRLAWMEVTANSQFILWTVPVESDGTGLRGGKPEVFLQTSFNAAHPMFSPDGRWLAYDSDESGSYQVYVRAFPDKGGAWQISHGGGHFPMWSSNGRELFFQSLDNQIMVADYAVKGDSILADQPRVWSEKRLADFGLIVATYDVAPDGKRIVALMPAEAAESQRESHVIFLENFFDELRRKVPLNAK
jgi:serine/threonine-protein kinase